MVPSFILGSGNAARALTSSLAYLQAGDAPVRVAPPKHIGRGESLPRVEGQALLFIANPHAFHAERILEAQRQGFTHIICEKPVVVSREQIEALRGVKAFVAVCHGYRQHWGPRRMRDAVARGEVGQLISIEGRYWQSSSASKALSAVPRGDGWKNDPKLSGRHDTLLDLGTHWLDLVAFLAGKPPEKAEVWKSHLNAEAAHRDTHIHMTLEFAGGLRSVGSISKTVHGAGNHLEVIVIGTRGVLRWNFEQPDQIVHAVGSETRILSRMSQDTAPSKLPAHHALGWLEGYVSIVDQTLKAMAGQKDIQVPTLQDSLTLAPLLLDS